MQIAVKISADVAQALQRKGPATKELRELLTIAEVYGVTLKPMHYDTKDPNLMRHFIVEVSEHESAQRVIDGLRQSNAIEMAYLKPLDELP
jgi:hypothetical protein